MESVCRGSKLSKFLLEKKKLVEGEPISGRKTRKSLTEKNIKLFYGMERHYRGGRLTEKERASVRVKRLCVGASSLERRKRFGKKRLDC